MCTRFLFIRKCADKSDTTNNRAAWYYLLKFKPCLKWLFAAWNLYTKHKSRLYLGNVVSILFFKKSWLLLVVYTLASFPSDTPRKFCSKTGQVDAQETYFHSCCQHWKSILLFEQCNKSKTVWNIICWAIIYMYIFLSNVLRNAYMCEFLLKEYTTTLYEYNKLEHKFEYCCMVPRIQNKMFHIFKTPWVFWI